MPVDESVTVKGTPVRSLQRFIETELTPEQRDAVFAKLPAEYAERFRGMVLPTETIPVHMLNVWTEEAAKAKGESLESFGQRAGRDAASDAVKGIYPFQAMVLTPTALLSRGGQMWRALYNRGDLRVEEETASGARISLPDFPSEAAGCSRMTGWIERMAQLTNVKDIKVEHTRCFAKGAPNCEWRITWK
jgi:predicted hydrocarbon binding protein